MRNDLGLLVKDIPQDDLQAFVKRTTASLHVRSLVDKVTVDYSWVEVLDEAIPYLDNIIRNPRRFITAEEDIIPIEKTKRVAEESIKHLAVHTNLIQDVDEEGMVKPIKLLNIFKEETIDLYENRFIFSLIKNLHIFLENQLTYKDQSTKNIDERSVKYEAKTNYHNQEINLSMYLSSRNKDESEGTDKVIEEREEKIKHIKEILEDFMASKFMKTMANATPVRSPIRKTNVILKEQNFRKALQLWEFLERYQIEKPVREYKEDNDITNKTFEKEFGMTYFLNYGILNEMVSKSGSIVLPQTADIIRSLYEYARKFDVDENKLLKDIEKEINKAVMFKKEQKDAASAAYHSFINNHQTRMKKAALLLK